MKNKNGEDTFSGDYALKEEGKKPEQETEFE